MKKRINKLFSRFKKTIKRPEMVLLPGQLAFFLVLATIPTVTLISYLASVLNLSTAVLYDFLQSAFSKDIANLILSTSTSENAGLGLTLVLIMCYYVVSNGTNAIIITSNTIYGIKNNNWFLRRLKAILIAIIFIVIIAFMLIVPVFGHQIIELIKNVNMNENVTNIIIHIYKYLRSPIMWIFLFIIIKTLYIIAPDCKLKSHHVNYGAVFTTVAWIVVTKVYSLYINNFANYSSLYGGLANICVLMIWFYFLAYCFVIGMSMNYLRQNDELEKNGILVFNK